MEQGDSLATINAQIGFDILCNRWTGIRFDQPGYTQSFECLDEFANWYEMLFIISDSGYGIEVFIPKAEGIPDLLLVMCKRFAVPGKF